MKTLIFAAVLLTSANAYAVMAFKSNEYMNNGSKICVYKFGIKEYAIKIASYKLCPISIDVPGF